MDGFGEISVFELRAVHTRTIPAPANIVVCLTLPSTMVTRGGLAPPLPFGLLVLNQAALHLPTGPWRRRVRDSNPGRPCDPYYVSSVAPRTNRTLSKKGHTLVGLPSLDTPGWSFTTPRLGLEPIKPRHAGTACGKVAERGGIEPPDPFRGRLFSKQLPGANAGRSFHCGDSPRIRTETLTGSEPVSSARLG